MLPQEVGFSSVSQPQPASESSEEPAKTQIARLYLQNY